ncbi:MAG: UvrD-helicase domain-containing protein [Deltaproteobacteria bacterium]|nr:UvrD-helicase domain-containing protein [Deltaproteobacteria bacterium]
MSDIHLLNPEQRAAACQSEGPVMILAGAGTGKTKVITNRIAWMLSEGIDPLKIAAMTFTNKAAKEMRERIMLMTTPEVGRKLSISTFHSFCLQFLRRWPSLFDLDHKFTLLGTGDQQDLVRRALDEKKWTGLFKADELHYQISQCKNWLVSPEDLQKGELPPQLFVSDPDILSAVYSLYERQLRLNSAIDFDDCIFKVVQALRKHETLKTRIDKRFSHYLVDEFQDTNAGQFAVLEELAREHGNVCVVGDDDQSIYSWRGAMYETLERFEKVFQGTRLIRLEQNYRCSNIILKAANTLIKNNSRRKGKTLWSQSDCQTPILLRSFSDSTEEARYIAEKCQSFRGFGTKPGDIAILYRANSQAKAIEMALREAGIPCKTYGGQSFFERKEVRDFFAYLNLALNPQDRLALWRVINVPPRGIGLKTQEHIEELAKNSGVSPWEILNRSDIASSFSSSAAAHLTEFTSIIRQLNEMPIENPAQCQKLGEAIIQLSGLADHLRKEVKHVLSRQHKIKNLMSLPTWIEQVASNISVGAEEEISGKKLMDALCLGNERPESSENQNENKVSLMTIHASKGLEFPVIFVAGLEEGLMPHKNSLETQEQVCEERRLFYVAITRAKQHLILTWARMRQSGFRKEQQKMSRFLSELPDDPSIINKEEQEELLSPEELESRNRKSTLAKLAQFRSSLGK